MSSLGECRIVRGFLVAGILAGAATLVSPVLAGECPADKKKDGVRQAVSLPATGVTDAVIGSIDVSREPARISDRQFRLRKLVVQPGGVVPWHSHADRPALIYIIEGEILEYASNCSVPILHKAGDVATETSRVSHWWKNLSDKPAVLLSADLLRDKADKNM